MAKGGNIKGVTIEIGGNTKKLTDALKSVNTQVSVTQKELTQINKALKFNPRNVDLLKQKYTAVNNAIKANSDKLKELKELEKELAKDPGQADKWRLIQREIIDTEQTLRSLEKQQKRNTEIFKETTGASGFFNSLGTKVEQTGAKIENLGNKAKPLSVAMTAAAASSVVAFNEVDEMMDAVVLKTGATGDSLQDLQNTATNVFTSSVAPSALDAGNAVGELNTRFGFTGEILEKSSIQFLKYAKVTGQDVNTAIINVSRAMGDAGIPAEQYNQVLDQLAVAGQASGISVDKLTETLTKFGAPMRQLGFDTKESIALFSSWEKAGVNTEIAFSGMKKAIGNWAKDGKDARVEFRKTLDEIAKAPDLATATTMAIEVFGQKAGPDLADAIKGGRFEFSEMLNLIESADGKVSETFDSQRDSIEDFNVALNSIKVAGAEFASVLFEVLAPILKDVADKLREWAKTFKELDPRTKEIIVKIALLVAGLAPLLVGIGKTVSAFGRLSKGIGTVAKFFTKGENGVSKFGSIISKLSGRIGKVFGLFGKLGSSVAKFVSKLNLLSKVRSILTGIATAFRALGVAFAANPFGMIVLALSLLGTALVIAYKKSETFRNVVDNAFKKVKEVVISVWQNYIKPAFEKIAEVWDMVVQKWNQHSETIKVIFKAIWEYLKNSWDNFWNTWKPVFELAWEFLKTTFENLWNTIKGIWDIFAGIFTGDWDRVWNGIKEVASSIWEQIKNVFQTVFDVIWEVVSTIIENVYNFISEKFNAVYDFISNIWSTIKETISNFITEAWNTVVEKATAIYNAVAEYFGQIPGKISDLWGQAVSYLQSIDLFQIGWNIIEGLANGLTSAGNWLWEKARSIASGVIDSMKSALGIASPARKMIPIGEDTGRGVIVGLDNMTEEVEDKSSELSESVIDGFDDTVLNGSIHSNLATSYELSQSGNVVSVLNGVLNELNSLKQNLNITSILTVDGNEIARSSHKQIDYLNGLNYKKVKGVW